MLKVVLSTINQTIQIVPYSNSGTLAVHYEPDHEYCCFCTVSSLSYKPPHSIVDDDDIAESPEEEVDEEENEGKSKKKGGRKKTVAPIKIKIGGKKKKKKKTQSVRPSYLLYR